MESLSPLRSLRVRKNMQGRSRHHVHCTVVLDVGRGGTRGSLQPQCVDEDGPLAALIGGSWCNTGFDFTQDFAVTL